MNKTVKRILQIGIPVVIVGALLIPRLGLFAGKSATNPVPAKRGTGQGSLPVSGMIATLSTSLSPYPVNGEFYPNEEVELVSETVGKVVQINFDDGDRVKKGDLLVKVDDSDLQAQLKRALLQKKLLEEKLDRQKALLKRESVSLESYQEMETDYQILLADIELLQVKINRTEIRAPFSGQMGFRYVSPGSYVQPSTKIATLTDNSILKLEFYLPERYISAPLIGKAFTLRADGVKDDITVEVYAVDPQIDLTTRTIMARGRYKNAANLPAGLFLYGELSWESEQFIPVPTEAVVLEMEGQRVWQMKDGKAKSVPVVTAGRDNRYVEVLSGIQVGDTILTSGLMQLREGMAVQVEVK